MSATDPKRTLSSIRLADQNARAGRLFGEQREHVVSHQVDRLGNGPNINARLQTLDAASKNGSHIGTG